MKTKLKIMDQFDGHLVKLIVIVYILCNQVIGLNSKSSILWKLNTKSGQIDSYSDSHQHVSSMLTILDNRIYEINEKHRIAIYVLHCE